MKNSVLSRPELGVWNFYFLLKLALASVGLLNFQPIPNLIFAAALIIPLPWHIAQTLRTVVAIPIGIALFYQDTWFPPFSRLLDNADNIRGFSNEYILELLGRFIHWDWVGLFFVALVAYYFICQWIRLTTLSLVGLFWFSVVSMQPEQPAIASTAASSGTNTTSTQQTKNSDNNTLNQALTNFHRTEASRHTNFPDTAESHLAFDVLVINICSMAWDDLESVGLRDNSLFQQMDIIFDHFNSATSYSGPASIRLLRASCGQLPHQQLYEPANQQCLLFNNLRQLGFTEELMLNHDGQFESYLDNVRKQTEMPPPAIDSKILKRSWISFAGPPLWQDQDVLVKWWQHRINELKTQDRVALFYNTITLHDGNRVLEADGGTRPANYKERASSFINDLVAFIKELQRSKRPVVLVIVPEHGAALHGDTMQISGMRELPTPSITHVPVGVKLINMDTPQQPNPVHVAEPSSYLALSELIARLLRVPSFQESNGFNWQLLTTGLPQTAWVSENQGVVVQEYEGVPYLRIKEQGTWLPYPHRFK